MTSEEVFRRAMTKVAQFHGPQEVPSPGSPMRTALLSIISDLVTYTAAQEARINALEARIDRDDDYRREQNERNA